MKRNKNKYRPTIISLVVSIVLFIGVSSFGQLLSRSANMAFEDYGFNVLIRIFGNDSDKQNNLADKLSTFGVINISRARQLTYKTNFTNNFLTNKAKESFPESYFLENTNVNLFGIGSEEFENICKSLNLKNEDFLDNIQTKAILINTTGNFYSNGKKYNISPYDIKKGTEFELFNLENRVDIKQNNINIVVVDEIKEIPKGILPNFEYNTINLIVSDKNLESFFYENQSPHLALSLNTKNADDFSKQAEELLSKELEKRTYTIANFEEQAKYNRNINILVMVFIYGFIAMLSLIGITSVIGTITTSISLRKKEFAMLQSVGMTQKGISQVLNLESFFYGINSLIIGIPIGIMLSFLLYKSLGSTLEFPYILPWQSILISLVVVMLITFSTMHYARNKQKNNNIVDCLREL